MTGKEKQKAIDALKISVPIMAMTREEFNDYTQTLNKIMDWLEQEPKTKEKWVHWTDDYMEESEEELHKRFNEMRNLAIIKTLEQEPTTDILDKIRNELLSMECMEEAVEVVDKYRLEIPFDGRDEE